MLSAVEYDAWGGVAVVWVRGREVGEGRGEAEGVHVPVMMLSQAD